MLAIGLYPNTKKQGVHDVLDKLVERFTERNVKVLIPEDLAPEFNHPTLTCDRELMKDQINLAITMGGDGTLLNVARDVASAGVPVCGINMGQLGFLTEIELPDLISAVDRLILGDYYLEERLMLGAIISREGQEIILPPALNDVVVTKGGFSRMIRLQVYIDGELAVKYPADGLIVATSTGSTGYSLSAGGPIINPNLKVIVLTPICPHTLYSRSLVVSEKEEIKITVHATHDDIVLTMDGQNVRKLQPEDSIIIRRSPFRARFARLSGGNYTQALRSKKLWRSDDYDSK